MARDAGAKNVYFASASPPVRFPNVYGIDMPAANELIAHDRNVEEIRDEIGADRLFYQDLEDLIWSVSEGNKEINQFEASVFTGDYVTGLQDDYLEALEKMRNDSSKKGQEDLTSIDIVNVE